MPTADTPFQIVRREKLTDQISKQLLSAILQGRFKEGERLPPERDLAVMFQASRAAVREAVSSLAAKGVTSVEQGRGTIVKRRTEWNVMDPMLFMLENGELVFDQLMEARTILEPEMAALAARNAPPESIERMRLILSTPLESTTEQHVETDTAFHLEIAKATGNMVLMILMSSVTDLLRQSRRRTFVVPGELEASRRCHEQVFAAIERRDPDAARQAMKDHMDQVRRALERFSTGERLPTE